MKKIEEAKKLVKELHDKIVEGKIIHAKAINQLSDAYEQALTDQRKADMDKVIGIVKSFISRTMTRYKILEAIEDYYKGEPNERIKERV